MNTILLPSSDKCVYIIKVNIEWNCTDKTMFIVHKYLVKYSMYLKKVMKCNIIQIDQLFVTLEVLILKMFNLKLYYNILQLNWIIPCYVYIFNSFSLSFFFCFFVTMLTIKLTKCIIYFMKTLCIHRYVNSRTVGYDSRCWKNWRNTNPWGHCL